MIFTNGKRFADKLYHLRLDRRLEGDAGQAFALARARHAVETLPIIVVDEAARVADAQVTNDPKSLCLAAEGTSIEPYTAPLAEQWIEYVLPGQPPAFIGSIVTRHEFAVVSQPVRDHATFARLSEQNARHVISCEMFRTAGGVVMWMGNVMLVVDGEGNHLETRMPVPPDGSPDERQDYADILHAAVLPIVVGMGLLTCRNVTLEDARPSGQQQREQQRKRKPPLKSYRVLTINQVEFRRARGPIGEPAPADMPWHRVIGHYARYGPKYGRGLLFGRLEGKWFIRDHERGDRANGVSERDYRLGKVDVPKPDAA